MGKISQGEETEQEGEEIKGQRNWSRRRPGAAAGGRGVGEGEDDVGFDDSFFQHDITTATAVSGRNSSCPSCARLLRLLPLSL